jgi:two-component system sensor histidine kinase HydH
MVKLDADSSIPNIIIEESARLNNIIKDFLDFARPKIPDLHLCRVEDVIEKNIAFLTPQIEKNNITIHKEIAQYLPEIMADSAMLYQAFLNLLLNSCQALDNNGTIIIKVRYQSENIVINFIDDGEGIPDKAIKKIWAPFFTTKDTGTGLGLGIVKNMIEVHNGTISITNMELAGANVEILLPV